MDIDRRIQSSPLPCSCNTAAPACNDSVGLLLNQFASAMEHSAIGTALVSLTGDWIHSNLAVQSLLGYDGHELQSKTFQDLTHPLDLETDLELSAGVLNGTFPSYQMEKRYVRKDGSYVWTKLTVSLVRDNAGQPVHFVAQIQDISRRKADEFYQRKLTERLSLATQAGGVGIWELDLTTSHTICDERMLELYGFDASHPQDDMESWMDAIHPEDQPQVQAKLEACIAGEKKFEAQYRVLWSDGQVRHIRGSAVTLRNNDGQCPRLVGINWDISDTVRLAEQAEAANRAKSEFLATISHELRTPLHGIIGFAELVREGGLTPEEQSKYLRHLSDAGKSLLTIVDDVLDLSKIDAGMLDLERTVVDLWRVVEGCEAIVRAECETKGLTLTSHIAAGIPQWIVADGTRLRQVLLNLCVNAKKFTDHGSVEISVFPGLAASSARFEVKDTGIGIDTTAQVNLFDQFTQADASTSRKYGGTGLGLSISKRIVEQMGGDIGVSSVLGRGSTFWFEVPIERKNDDQARNVEPAQTSKNLNILVAEDVYVNQVLIRAILERGGHTVDIADDGRHAVSAAEKQKYDLILMDIQMPRMDGVSATEAIRSSGHVNSHTPIWAMTANALSEHLDGYMAAGMDDFVTKPFDSERLLAKLSQAAALPADPGSSRLVLNSESVHRLIASIGSDAGRLLLINSAEAIEKSSRLIQANYGFPEIIASEAHKLISISGNVGLERLSEVARVLEDRADRGCALQAPLQSLLLECTLAIEALTTLRPQAN